jgi:hypothetical protein
LFQSLQIDVEQGQALARIIVQVSGNARTLLLLGAGQAFPQGRKFFLRPFSLGNVLIDREGPDKGVARINFDSVEFHVDQRAVLAAALRHLMDGATSLDSF